MWVARVTEGAEQGEEEDQYLALTDRFPQYRFGIIHGER